MAAANPFHFLGTIKPNPSIRDFGRNTKFGHEDVWIKKKIDLAQDLPELVLYCFD